MATSTWAEHTAVTITIKEQGGKVRNYDLDDFVGFSMTKEKLKMQLLEQPAKFAYVAALHAAAMTGRERFEERLSFKKAELDGKIRTAAKDEEIKVTEEQVKNLIRTHKEYVAIQDECMRAREQEELLRAMRDALIQRKDIMVLVANNFRHEWDSDPGARVDRQVDTRYRG